MPEFYHAQAMINPAEGRPHLFVATPATQIYGNHMASVSEALQFLLLGGIAADHYVLTGNCHVDDARNTCVAAFLATQCEALIFIDADVGFPKEALYRLAMHKGDVVAGAYPKKEALRAWPVRFDDSAGEVREGEDGLVRHGVVGLPTGFMKIHRRVLEAMVDLDKRRFAPFGDHPDAPLAPLIFERELIGAERVSGDFAFCRRAKALGFELALDPHLPFTHAGEWRFGGCLIEDWRRLDEERGPQTEMRN
jgi:hypothetical protein